MHLTQGDIVHLSEFMRANCTGQYYFRVSSTRRTFLTGQFSVVVFCACTDVEFTTLFALSYQPLYLPARRRTRAHRVPAVDHGL